MTHPRVCDNDRDEITVTLDGREIRGWSYRDEAERDNLDYADSGVNVTARKAIIDRQIASIRKAVA